MCSLSFFISKVFPIPYGNMSVLTILLYLRDLLFNSIWQYVCSLSSFIWAESSFQFYRIISVCSLSSFIWEIFFSNSYDNECSLHPLLFEENSMSSLSSFIWAESYFHMIIWLYSLSSSGIFSSFQFYSNNMSVLTALSVFGLLFN